VSARADEHRGALDAVDRILNRGGDADDVLRAVVDALHERVPAYARVGIVFLDEGREVEGPARGDAGGADHLAEIPVRWRDLEVARLDVAATEPFAPGDQDFLERVAVLISNHCLVGWDTGGEGWTP
jgi:hypothetical protein